MYIHRHIKREAVLNKVATLTFTSVYFGCHIDHIFNNTSTHLADHKMRRSINTTAQLHLRIIFEVVVHLGQSHGNLGIPLFQWNTGQLAIGGGGEEKLYEARRSF